MSFRDKYHAANAAIFDDTTVSEHFERRPIRRVALTDEQRAARNERVRCRRASLRSDEQRASRNEIDRRRRQILEDDNSQRRRLARNERLRRQRAALTDEQRAAKNTRRREQRATVVSVMKSSHRTKIRAARLHDIDGLAVNAINVIQHTCGSMDVKCVHCSALMWSAERTSGTILRPQFGICCSAGKVSLGSVPDPPSALRALYTGSDDRSAHYRNNIRKFNAGMAMASMKATDKTVRGGLANYRIQGVVYRRIGPVRAAEGEQPGCLQTYFYDADEQAKIRVHRQTFDVSQQQLDDNIFRVLGHVLHDAPNSYLQSFLTIQEQIDAGNIPPDIEIGLHSERRPEQSHSRTYNLPTSNEVAILLPQPSATTAHDRNRMVVCKFRATSGSRNELRSFDETHRSYDPLQYPCFFPHGTEGWHPGLQQTNSSRRLTAAQFYASRMMKRPSIFNVLHHGGRLFQQYCVDQYAKIESNRLTYIRFHQKELRADLYQGLADAVQAGDADRSGKRCILPGSFTGGPRFMSKHYQDAMAIVRKFGKPTLFVTMTANPKWEEIVSQLAAGQTASDRPDIVSRVFRMKQRQLLDDVKSGVLGDLQAHVNTIEFQKRGLPHCHFLFIMKKEQQTWEEVDKVVCAELPDPNNPLTSELYEVVKRHMIHGPCGDANPACACMRNGQCSKMFPMNFTLQTRLGDDSYPDYRRRPPSGGGHSATVRVKGREVQIDNRNVVPYNPWLLMKYRSHINVHYCASIKAVRYIYKYIYKGSDHATVSFQLGEDAVGVEVAVRQEDEIEQYLNCRYIGASEASWRIFEFPIQDRHPAVENIPVHLPGQQTVVFNPDSAQQALDKATVTKLTAYFTANGEHPAACSILYCDFPQYFTWHNENKKWNPRARQPKDVPQTIGRVHSVHPSQGDTFYLRLLLHHKPGAKSFDDLRTVDGKLCETFKAACRELNLLEDDYEWFECLTEAANAQSGFSIRSLFTTILTFCEPNEPLALYDKFKDYMAADFRYARRLQDTDDAARAAATENDLLCDLDDRLRQQNKCTVDFGLPAADRSLQRSQLSLVSEEVDREAELFFTDRVSQLNADQLTAFNIIQQKIDNKQGGIVFLDAPGGTGKTFLLNVVLAYVRKQSGIALATASSGIAATLLKLGRTAHSRFKLPIPPLEESLCNVSPRDATGRLLQAADLLVWDEAPMSHRYLIEALDRSLQDIMSDKKPLGGKLLILGGDFRQILPVIRRGRRPSIVDACIKNSALWKDCTTVHLRTNMRVQNCLQNDSSSAERLQHYADWLLQLGEGKLPHVTGTTFNDVIELPDELCVSSEDDVVQHVYGDIELRHRDGDSAWFAGRGILTSTNAVVDRLNDAIMDRLAGEPFIASSVDTVADMNQAALYPTEFLNSISLSGLPPHQMTLKVGAPIMLLRNLDPSNGHCNGTRYILKSVSARLLETRMLVGERAGSLLLIPRILLSPSDTDLPFRLRRRQFPIRPAFAMSINKSQGQSLECCGIVLPTSVFTHGQLYVAASRVGDPLGLRIFADQHEFRSDKSTSQHKVLTRNVVYSEVV